MDFARMVVVEKAEDGCPRGNKVRLAALNVAQSKAPSPTANIVVE
jgi:hypothetical protein